MEKSETVINHTCVIIPTYNNGGTVADVVARALQQTPHVIVVNDGSDDDTLSALQPFDIILVSYDRNRGKGHALKEGFRKARELGFRYAVTLDADGQHFPEDIPLLLEVCLKYPQALIVGVRNLTEDNMPRGNTFANRFSNFWFCIQTLRRVADTQSGFRLYPLSRMKDWWIVSSRYEAELGLLVLAAWLDVEICQTDVRVHYPPQHERVTHFRPGLDFARISVLNTLLCVGALFFYLPKLLVYNLPRSLWFRLKEWQRCSLSARSTNTKPDGM